MAPITRTQPTVTLIIGGSWIAFADNGEILETVEVDERGWPDWTQASIADHRGIGGKRGYLNLAKSLALAEGNAALMDDPIVRVPIESVA